LLPAGAKRFINSVLVAFDLSIMVSVPTSNRPMDEGWMLYFLSRDETTVSAIELMSSLYMSAVVRVVEGESLLVHGGHCRSDGTSDARTPAVKHLKGPSSNPQNHILTCHP
jgi:hypothetical protein